MKKEEKEQLEGEKRNESTQQSEGKRRKGETSSKGEVPHLERNSNFFIEHQQQARWGGIQLRSGYSHSTAGECAAHAIFCCKVNRSLFGRCCI